MSHIDEPTTSITGRWADTEGITMNHNMPLPSFDKTYRRVDGQTIAGNDWVNSLEYLDGTEYPVELIEEIWVRTAIRTFWHLPPLYACEIDECDNDAVGWERRNHVWYQVCEHHQCCELQCRPTRQERPRDQ